MKILIKSCEQDEIMDYVQIRIEQEKEPFNSFNPTIELLKVDTVNLSNDELYTLAFNRVKGNILNKFENDIRGYVEEEFNFEGFDLISPKHNSIEINGVSEILKETNKDFNINYNSIIKDQYGDFFKDGNIELKEEYPNVTLENGLLTVGDFSGQIILKSTYYSLVKELIINVTQVTKKLSEQDIMMNAILELYEKIEVK